MTANLSAMTWWQYVEHVTDKATQEAIARRVNVSTPTVSRWQGSTPKPETVAAFARAYSRPVLEAFIAAGFLTEEDARVQVIVERYETPDDDTLLRLLSERLGRDRKDVDDEHSAPTSRAEVSSALEERRQRRSAPAPEVGDTAIERQAARELPEGGSMRQKWDISHGSYEVP